MRNEFLAELSELAARDERVWLVTGDLGYSVVEPFRERFPDRFLNAGIAEQNMMGVAAGLAMAGKIPYVYSIGNFPTVRCLEQLRNDVCYHNLPVKVVAVGGGVAYGSLGYTHHAVEDLAILGSLPNLAIGAPADPYEAEAAVIQSIRWKGPAYVRLGKAGEPRLHDGQVLGRLGDPIVVRNGVDAVVFCTGGVLETALEAHVRTRATIVSVPWLNPLNAEAILDLAAEVSQVVTYEEHVAGGLGSRVAELLLADGWRGTFRSVRLNGRPASVSGSQTSLREAGGAGLGDLLLALQSPGSKVELVA